MSGAIEWATHVWNPTRGCSRVSEGCRHCYAERVAARFSGPGQPYEGLAVVDDGHPRWTGKVRLVPKVLAEPLRWRKPRRIFVNSMSDLFHEKLTDQEIAAIFGVMSACSQHTFLVLTKRPERMPPWFEWISGGPTGHEWPSWKRCGGDGEPFGWCRSFAVALLPLRARDYVRHAKTLTWPLPNVWLGVSVEDQATATERIPPLLRTPAALRFVSYEPALGPVDFRRYLGYRCMNCGAHGSDVHEWGNLDGPYSSGHTVGSLEPEPCGPMRPGNPPALNWIIIGGESGPRARPCEADWIRSTMRQCREARVPVFVKQLGAAFSYAANGIAGCALHVDADVAGLISRRLRDPKGGDPDEWPAPFRARELP